MSRVSRRSIAHRHLTRANAVAAEQMRIEQASEASASNAIIDLTIDADMNAPISRPICENESTQNNLYQQLQDLSETDGVIRNFEFIFCEVCDIFIDVYDGILVRECLHQVCIDCIRKVIIECVNVDVKCPNKDCEYFLQDREVRSLLTPTEYEHHSKKYALAADDDGDNNNHNEHLYEELMKLEQQGVIYNTESFECEICFTEIEVNDGIIIRECLHKYCIDCIRQTIIQVMELQ